MFSYKIVTIILCWLNKCSQLTANNSFMIFHCMSALRRGHQCTDDDMSVDFDAEKTEQESASV